MSETEFSSTDRTPILRIVMDFDGVMSAEEIGGTLSTLSEAYEERYRRKLGVTRLRIGSIDLSLVDLASVADQANHLWDFCQHLKLAFKWFAARYLAITPNDHTRFGPKIVEHLQKLTETAASHDASIHLFYESTTQKETLVFSLTKPEVQQLASGFTKAAIDEKERQRTAALASGWVSAAKKAADQVVAREIAARAAADQSAAKQAQAREAESREAEAQKSADLMARQRAALLKREAELTEREAALTRREEASRTAARQVEIQGTKSEIQSATVPVHQPKTGLFAKLRRLLPSVETSATSETEVNEQVLRKEQALRKKHVSAPLVLK